MKLVYIANIRIPTEKAHGIQVMQMLRAFAKSKIQNPKSKIEEKIEVELVAPKRINPIKQDPFEYYGIQRNFKIKKLFCLDFIALDKFLGPWGLWLEQASLAFSLFFYLLFKRAKFFYTRDRAFLWLLFFLRKNYWVEVHDISQRFFLYAFFLKRVKGIVAITQNLKEELIKRGIKPEKILVAGDGVDVKKFPISNFQFSNKEIRRKLNLPVDKKIVMYCGHLYEWKGAGVLLEAAKQFSIFNFQFSNEGKETLFVLVGGTEKDIKSFEFRVSRLGLSNVLMAGYKLPSEIPLWLVAADILVLPNSGKFEISQKWTSPLKMFEYMAAKKPIVASDLPSIREVLNEKNAIFAQSDNPESFSRAIDYLLKNPEFSAKIAEQAFLDVQDYTWEKRAEKVLDFFAGLKS